MEGTDKFPIQKCAIFRKFKEIGGIARWQTVLYAAQAIPPIDAEIAGKGHLWTETSSSTIGATVFMSKKRVSVKDRFRRPDRYDSALLREGRRQMF